ncbi:MAG TPA: NAD(P)H-hydrate dehydratase [Sphingomicrobium sp.]|nr:NAD(P)H-hydrate dehydratase [Sphingomicrobium sp.]
MKAGKPLTRSALKRFPLPALADGDKETKGRVLIVAGSRSTPGAALLAATSAMRSGAGKLRIVSVESIATELGIAMPESMVIGLAEARDGGFARSAVGDIKARAAEVSAVVAGPGMARAQTCTAIATALCDSGSQLVLDAALLRGLKPPKRPRRGPLPILLPHAGELADLLELAKEAVEADPVGCGRRAAELYQAHVLVKGVVSHVVAADGSAWTFRGGAPGLGVSGSGDTLAGIVGGLLARGAEPLTALLWGVLLHGEAGEMLARRIGPAGFLAREIPGELPALLFR